MLAATAQKTGYGLWVVTVRADDGREATGGGMSESEADYRARMKLERAPCGRCGAELGGGEAAVSRRAYGEALCATCRRVREGREPADYGEPFGGLDAPGAHQAEAQRQQERERRCPWCGGELLPSGECVACVHADMSESDPERQRPDYEVEE